MTRAKVSHPSARSTFCRDFFLKNQCHGQWGRSRNCPVMNAQGWVCNAAPKVDSPGRCPNRSSRGPAATGETMTETGEGPPEFTGGAW